MNRPTMAALVAGLPVALLLLAGCGGGSSTSDGAGSALIALTPDITFGGTFNIPIDIEILYLREYYSP